ncbi:unnamed protein product [Cuscuta epithymum]|uniref:Pentatricopeptide repeat-containing protein n=1 Tax=Cuscuta epithymum TaxID=186058 RepID=A0AAV0DUE0_9ASTE|nr:unnamed protein product [Cuscuta epithymum]
MVTIAEIPPLAHLRLTQACSLREGLGFTYSQNWPNSRVHSCFRISASVAGRNPSFPVRRERKIQEFKLFSSLKLNGSVTSDDEDEMGEGFFEAIEELERMTRDPSDVLQEMNQKLSTRELQLVLVYFAQEGRDSWCALEVFDWLRKENRVDKETMELMVSIMCGWIKKLIDTKSEIGDIVDLLVDMDCVGLKPSFSMMEKVVSLYWEAGEKEGAVGFVKEVLRRKMVNSDGNPKNPKGGPTCFLAWKMMEQGSYREAAALVINIRDCGLQPEVYSYLIAMTAVLKELNEFGKALRKLKSFAKSGLVVEMDPENITSIEKYQNELLADGVRLSNWVVQEGGPSLLGTIHERLLAMYMCSGRGVEAEQHLWQMKFMGKEVNRDLYDIVLAICASQNEAGSIGRLLTRMDTSSSLQKKKSLSWLMKGYIKGGHLEKAAETLKKMLEFGLRPELVDRVALLQGLRRRIQQPGGLEAYLDTCKCLSHAELVGPCVVYLYIKKYRLWMMKML